MSVLRDVAVDVLEVPFREPIEASAGRWERRRLALVRLTVGEGIEGLGEVAAETPDGIPAGIGSALADGIWELLGGVDLDDARAVRARLRRMASWPLVGRAVASAVGTAIGDASARLAGISMASAMTSAARASVRVNGFVGARDVDAAVRDAEALAEAGFTCLKVKGGAEPAASTIARVAAVRAAVGHAVDLRLDVNGAWDLATAKAALRALTQFDLEYVEQPLPVTSDPDDLAGLRSSAEIAIAADESVTDVDAARSLLQAKAVDVLVVKPARVGGVTPGLEIAEVAATFDAEVVISTLFETGIGTAAALQLAAALVDHGRAHGLGTVDLLETGLVTEPLRVRGGWMDVPGGPGIGVSIDRAAIEDYRAR